MIKAAIEKILTLGKEEIKTIEVNNRQYAVCGLELIQEPKISPLKINTLDSLVSYLKANIDYAEKRIIHIVSPTNIKVYSEVDNNAKRHFLIECDAFTPIINYGRFYDVESFNILLQSAFIQTDYSKDILKIVGNITEQDVKATGDDGVSQTVTAKTGIVKVENITVPNPVILKPYRTFLEVEQPESSFVFRMQSGPNAALFEADGGAWKLDAIINIKKYLEKELSDIPTIYIIN